jgi:undecaprenyl phosphate-alpha-L-ara4N flippase subunit ArnE
MTTSPFAVVGVIVVGMVGSFGFLLLKYASKKIKRCLKDPIKNYELFLALFMQGLSFLLYMLFLRFGDVSVLYPLISLNYIWVTLLSMKYLKEKMNWWKWVGISCLIIAVILTGIGSLF